MAGSARPATGHPGGGGAVPAVPRRRRSTAFRVLLVLDALLVLGFLVLLGTTLAGGDEGSTPDPAAEPTATATAEPETTPEDSAPADPAQTQNLAGFVLPSGNIHCAMTESTATCTILEYSFTPPAPPEGCGTLGGTLTVDAAAGASFVCADTPAPAPAAGTPVLEYGGGSTVGEMTCLSSQNGVFCRHNPTGAGFSLARAGTQIF